MSSILVFYLHAGLASPISLTICSFCWMFRQQTFQSMIFELMKNKLQWTKTEMRATAFLKNLTLTKCWWMQNQILMRWSPLVRSEGCSFICSYLFSYIFSKPQRAWLYNGPIVKGNILFYPPFFPLQQEFKQLFGCWNTHWRILMFTEIQNQNLIASRHRTEIGRKGFDMFASNIIVKSSSYV